VAERDENDDKTVTRSYRAGGIPHGARDAGPDGGRRPGEPRSGAEHAEPGQEGGNHNLDRPGPSGSGPMAPSGRAATGDLGAGWGVGSKSGAAAPAAPEGVAAPSSYEGWSGRTGQDYQPDGTQSFAKPSGPWARGVDPDSPHSAEDAGSTAEAKALETMRGEAAYNQSFREPYGAYQGGYPGEATRDAWYSAEYASWRAAQLKQLDDDYRAWRSERGDAADDDLAAFESWRQRRVRS